MANSLRIIPKMAWRNVWRNTRRTLLTLMTIVVGCAMIIFINALGKGGHNRMIEDAVALNTGHLQIHEKGFWQEASIDYAFQPSAGLKAALAKDARIKGFSERIVTGGLLYFHDASRGVLIQGIDPVHETQVTDLHAKILPGGRFLRADDRRGIVIGSTLAKNTGAAVGDRMAMISQGFDGSIAAERFTVVGIFRSGSPEYDREMVLIPLFQADETFTMMNYVHAIAIRLKDAADLAAVKADLVPFEKSGPTPLETMGWNEMMPELVQFIVLDDFGNYIYNFILFVVVAFGILNTIQMSVFERTREFGVMLSLGTRPRQIVALVMTESALIAVIGILLGIAAGLALGWYFAVHPIDYGRYSEEIAVWGITTTVYPAETTLSNIGLTAAITFVLAVLFSIFPARRAANLNPVEAIRKL